jgi:hypothetical protein
MIFSFFYYTIFFSLVCDCCAVENRFGQRCGEIQVKVHANLEVDVQSQLREARQRVHQLQHKVNHLEEEQMSLRHRVQATQTQLEDAMETDRSLSAEEERDCDSLLKGLSEVPAESSLEGDVLDDLKSLSRVALISVVRSLSRRVSDCRQRSRSGSSEALSTCDLTRARALLDNCGNGGWMDGVEDDDGDGDGDGDRDDLALDEANSDKSDDTHNNSRVTLSSSHRQCSDEVSVDRLMDVASLVTHSKRVRQLLDGITVVTTGTFGNSKTKLLSLSPDLKQLVWKDILNKSTKKEDVAAYRGFKISDVKSEQGVIVKYEHRNKSKKMEILQNNLHPDENRSRVLKWIGLLNSLAETAT